MKLTVTKPVNLLGNKKKAKNNRQIQQVVEYVRKTSHAPKVDVKPLRVDPENDQKTNHVGTIKIPGLNESENAYAKTLMNPWHGTDVKIPNVFPIPTKTLTYRGVMGFKSDAQGYARVIVRPYEIANTISASVATPSGGPDSDQQLNIDIDFNFQSMCSVWMGKLASGTYNSRNLQVQRYRVVSAATKVTNVTSATTRSGYITGVHTLETPDTLTPTQARMLEQSITKNADNPVEIPWVPHDPNCYNFYEYTVKKDNDVYLEEFDEVKYAQMAPADIRSNCIYYGITGAPSQEFSLDYVINIEYVPGTEFVALLNPVADARGDPNKTVLTLGTASPKASFWDRVLDVGGDIAIQALKGLGNVAVAALL